MKIAVGSKNPAKIKAVLTAFQQVFPDKEIQVDGVAVASEVPDQPMHLEETIRGARNRAIKSLSALDADMGVGLEGGLQEIDGRWFTSGWIVIIDKKGNEGIGSSIFMELPEKVMMHIRSGKELGHATDAIFHTVNAKHAQGYFGLMTDDAVTRDKAYSDAVLSALSRFIHPEVFE